MGEIMQYDHSYILSIFKVYKDKKYNLFKLEVYKLLNGDFEIAHENYL